LISEKPREQVNMILAFAFVLGIVSGLRTFTSPAAVMLRAAAS